MTAASLKLVVAWSERRNLCTLVQESLRELAGEREVQVMGDDAAVVHTGATAAELRDVIREHLESGDQLLVVEFEVWSSSGDGVDARWLLARGH